MINLFVLIAVVACSSMVLNAQSIERQVIGSTGGYASANGVSVSFTVGEPVIETAVSGSVTLTQGFQQPDDITVGIDDVKSVSVNYTVFPNPTEDLINIELMSDVPANVKLSLYDLNGRKVDALDHIIEVNGTVNERMDLSQLAPAQYILMMSDVEGQVLKTFKVQKVN